MRPTLTARVQKRSLLGYNIYDVGLNNPSRSATGKVVALSKKQFVLKVINAGNKDAVLALIFQQGVST